MSLHKQALTNYYNFAVQQKPVEKCAKCGEVMKGWAKSKCSVCNRFFCQSHMKPYLGPNKKCPDCWERLNSLKSIDAVPTAFQQANSYYIENKTAEANDLERKIFASIFGSKNLIRFAAEDENNDAATQEQNSTEKTQEETPPQEGPQVEPDVQSPDQVPPQPKVEEEQKTDNTPEMKLLSLVDLIAKDIMAQIQVNPGQELTEEEILQLFEQKLNSLEVG